MSDRTLVPCPELTVGALVRTPAGREARVLRIDQARQEADVELVACRAAFRLSKLVPLDQAGDAATDTGVLILSTKAEGSEGEG